MDNKIDKYLIPEYKSCWKLASIQVFSFLLLFPDLFEYAHTFGWVDELPDTVKWSLRGIAVLGIFARLWSQQKGSRNENQ